nr:unnamed protein product [Digitaria exilis]
MAPGTATTREEEDEWRNGCSSAAVATAAMAIDTRFSSRRTCPSMAPVEGDAAPLCHHEK